MVGNYGICNAQNLAWVIASSTPGKDCMSDDAFADDDSDLYKSLRLSKGLSAVKALPAKKAPPHLGQHGSCLEGLKVHGDKKGKQTYVRANLLEVLVVNHFSILGSDIVQKSVLVNGFAAVPFRFHVAENQGAADGSRNQDETRILV